MRFTPASAVGVALLVACVAPAARDTRAPHARIAMRTLCLSTGARSRFGTYLWVDGRGAGDCALGTRAATAACVGCAPVARGGGRQVGRWMARHFALNHTTRADHDFPPKKIRHSHGHHSGVRQYFSTIFSALKSAKRDLANGIKAEV